jgi:BirA family biotin operon repressor/biotin-[acetyl-CoA-carboxylase] ligase
MVLLSKIIDDLLIEGTFVSGEEIARKVGVSRTAVFKHIRLLRRDGYSIESVRGKGYRLLPRFDGLLPLEVIWERINHLKVRGFHTRLRA